MRRVLEPVKKCAENNAIVPVLLLLKKSGNAFK